jgi:hypothetical protein
MNPNKRRIKEQKRIANIKYLRLAFIGKQKIDALKSLVQLTNLKHLNAAGCYLVDHDLVTIGQVTSLELLDLDLTDISNNGLQHLSNLTNLSELRLKDNPQLTDDCVNYLLHFDKLKLIYIANTSITINGIKKMLSHLNLKTIILDSNLDNDIEELLLITEKYPKLKITLKGRGEISNGKIR